MVCLFAVAVARTAHLLGHGDLVSHLRRVNNRFTSNPDHKLERGAGITLHLMHLSADCLGAIAKRFVRWARTLTATSKGIYHPSASLRFITFSLHRYIESP